MASSVLCKYLEKSKAMDVWEETKHHRADDGRFTSGQGRGKAKSDEKEKSNGKGKGDDEGTGRKEMSEEKATRIVRRAFADAKCELKGLKLVAHHLRAEVREADEGSLKEINGYLSKRGLKAQIQDKTSYKIAEDGFDDIQVVDDPMLEVLVDLCRIEMLAKDLHYRAVGKAFYGIHEMADLVKGIADDADDLNEVHYMGEKQEDPPERSYVAAKAAELVGRVEGEDALLQKLTEACSDAAKAVEAAKSKGVSGGTSSVLDDISKKSLQAKGLLLRTMAKSVENNAAIDKVIGKGIYFKPDAAAQDAGTSEGAKKGWQTRKNGGAYQPTPPDQGNEDLALEIKDEIVNNDKALQAIGSAYSARNPDWDGDMNDEGYQDFEYELIQDLASNGGDWRKELGSRLDAAVVGFAQDAGTSEGAKKGWTTRKSGSSYALGGHEGAVYRDVSDLTDGGDVDEALAKRYSSQTGKNPYDENGEESEGFSGFKYSHFLKHMKATPGHDPQAIATSIRKDLGLGGRGY